MNYINNDDMMVKHTLQHGGGTFLLPRCYPMNQHAQVYCLSLDDDRGITMHVDDFDFTTLAMWRLNGNDKYIEQWNSRQTRSGSLKAIGTWVEGETVYIDVATILNKEEWELDTVLELARTNNQVTIWDNDRQLVIESGLR